MKYIFILISAVSLLFIRNSSCNNSEYNEAPTLRNNMSVKYTIYDYNIDSTEIDSVSYSIFDIKRINGKDYLFILNKYFNSLDMYDLNDRKKIKRISFKNSLDIETEKYGEINSIFYHNADTIIILQHFRILMLNDKSIFYTYSINDKVNNRLPEYSFKNLSYFPIYYLPKDHTLLIQHYCSGCQLTERKFYETKIEGSINLFDHSRQIYPIKYSSLYLSNYYGFAIHAYRLIKGDTSIYSFAADPNIYIFNRKNQILNIVGGKSQFQTSNIPPLSKKMVDESDIKYRHFSQIPMYQEIYYDPYRKVYYRFFLKSQSEKNDDGFYNSWGDRETILMVLDENFTLIDEIVLDKYIYNSQKCFVTPDGLFISTDHYKNPKRRNNVIGFKIIKIKQ